MKAAEVYKLIQSRRTVRQFNPKKAVSKASLERILKAGTWAPYAPYFPQGWKFIALKGKHRAKAVSIITKSKTILKYIRKAYEQSPWGPLTESAEEHDIKAFARDFATNLGNAPVMIVGLVPWSKSEPVLGHNYSSGWCAAQNMMLQAEAEGLHSGVITFHSPKVENRLVDFLGLKKGDWVVAFTMNVGHATVRPKPAKRLPGRYEIRG